MTRRHERRRVDTLVEKGGTVRHEPLPEERPHWFNPDQAERFDESTFWDGDNNVSFATGSEWDHETLYRTADDQWVKHFTSQYEGRGESWAILDPEEAYTWLLQNGHEEAVPEYFLAQEED